MARAPLLKINAAVNLFSDTIALVLASMICYEQIFNDFISAIVFMKMYTCNENRSSVHSYTNPIIFQDMTS